jgi:hypothetical protein
VRVDIRCAILVIGYREAKEAETATATEKRQRVGQGGGPGCKSLPKGTLGARCISSEGWVGVD